MISPLNMNLPISDLPLVTMEPCLRGWQDIKDNKGKICRIEDYFSTGQE
jgi:hypothetical protein